MPIYWGCTNMEEFFPKNSYYYLNVAHPNAIDEAMEIIMSDYREKNIKALEEAKSMILNKYQFWPTIEKNINGISKT